MTRLDHRTHEPTKSNGRTLDQMATYDRGFLLEHELRWTIH